MNRLVARATTIAALAPLLVVAPLGVCEAAASVQTTCLTPFAGVRYAWPRGRRVRVYIDPAFRTTRDVNPYKSEKEGVQQGVLAWSNPGCSGVTFEWTTNPSNPTDGSYKIKIVKVSLPNGPDGLPTLGTCSRTPSNGVDRTGALIQINSCTIEPTRIEATVAHEMGHTFGLDEGDCSGASVMDYPVSGGPAPCEHNDCGGGPDSCKRAPQAGDVTALNLGKGYCEISGGDPPPPNGTCGWQAGMTCPAGWSFAPAPPGPQPVGYTYCCYYTPILVDVDGDGFNLTDAPGGVLFDIRPGDLLEQVSWTSAGSDDAWLTLDRNGNGVVDDGAELFGNYTPQPVVAEPHGFLALSEIDRPENGGTADGRIDTEDAGFDQLRLWQDANHDGVSEPSELDALLAFGVAGIDLDFRASRRTDAHGNAFRYRAKLYDESGPGTGRWAWDVFLQVAP